MTVVSAWTHGDSAYRNGRCKCDRCRDQHAARWRDEKAQRTERLAADPTLAPHGTKETYRNWGCRCDPCTVANSKACRDRRRRRQAVDR